MPSNLLDAPSKITSRVRPSSLAGQSNEENVPNFFWGIQRLSLYCSDRRMKRNQRFETHKAIPVFEKTPLIVLDFICGLSVKHTSTGACLNRKHFEYSKYFLVGDHKPLEIGVKLCETMRTRDTWLLDLMK